MNYQRMPLLDLDPWLDPSENDIYLRYKRFVDKLNEIEHHKGSLFNLANAYNYFGINYNKSNKCWTYREWAPGAHALFLTGEFNNWDKYAHPLKRIDGGIWEIILGKDELKHGDKIKVVVQSQLGEQFRIPAYIRRVEQDEDTKNFSAQVWSPEPFDWKGDNFTIPKSGGLFIYECHVGMAQETEGLGSYSEFTNNILPRIQKAGYNAIQLMAIQEHPYYGSFGYHVANFFAPSSRFGTPEELKTLVKTAHKMGIAVILDIVHSHTVKNINEGLNKFDGTDHQYFHSGPRGEHQLWDSMLFDYGKMEVLQFLLSNVSYWLKEFRFDGFRFDGVGSMMYFHHGDETIDNQKKYFSDGVEYDAITYLQLANYLAHEIKKKIITIAEDVTGMPGLTVPINDGGMGFDYRLGMGIPDFWIKLLKEVPDEDWNVSEMWRVLNDRLPYVNTVSYCESHDQALVGDKTIAFRLMDKEMYYNMRTTDSNPVVDRGIALHKMIRIFTLALGGQAYLNFMGNEFGHPEWIDFPREGNDWSFKHARRQWSLVDNSHLYFSKLASFDIEMIRIAKSEKLLSYGFAKQLNVDEANKTLIFERGPLIFIFNFHISESIPGYEFFVPEGGSYQIILNTDNVAFGGLGRINENMYYPTNFHSSTGTNHMRIYLTSRTAIVMRKIV
ncbi:MAG: alpha-amylase family glycosyl hydrolase [Bacteroidales bacterium]